MSSAPRWPGRSAVPEASVVFTVKLPASLAARVREHARESGSTISAVVARALTEFLARGHRGTAGAVSERVVETVFVFDRHAATDLSVAYGILVPERRARRSAGRPGRKDRPPHDQRGDLRPGVLGPAEEGRDDRVADRGAARRTPSRRGWTCLSEWVFEDDGHSGATLVRPALERLRDLVAGVGVEVVLCYSPDRLARKFAYQALLIEEFTRAGTRVEFVKGPRGDSPEDQLMVQFQGMFAEYEKAQIMERYRRGKAHRARAGSVNVLSGAPFGYRYVAQERARPGAPTRSSSTRPCWSRELFRRYTDDGASIADLARWLTEQGVPDPHRQDPLGPLRGLGACCATRPTPGRRCSARPWSSTSPPAVNRVARHAGPHHRPRDQGRRPARRGVGAHPGPGDHQSEDTFERAGQRLADNKRFASRNSKVPSLLQGLAACAGCGYAYYRTTTRTTQQEDLLLPVPGHATTTATKAGGSARTSRSAPTTSTKSSGTTSPPCWPTPP